MDPALALLSLGVVDAAADESELDESELEDSELDGDELAGVLLRAGALLVSAGAPLLPVSAGALAVSAGAPLLPVSAGALAVSAGAPLLPVSAGALAVSAGAAPVPAGALAAGAACASGVVADADGAGAPPEDEPVEAARAGVELAAVGELVSLTRTVLAWVDDDRAVEARSTAVFTVAAFAIFAPHTRPEEC